MNGYNAVVQLRTMSMDKKLDLMVASGTLTPEQAEVGKRTRAKRQAAEAEAEEAARQAEQPA